MVHLEISWPERGETGLAYLFDSRDSLATRNDRSEDVALHGNTEGKRYDIEQEKVGSVGGGGLAGKDTGLNGGTVGDGLVGVDALLELLATEEVAEELLDLGDTGRTTDKHDLVDLALVEAGVLQDLLDRLNSAGESLVVDVLETGAGDLGVEVLAVVEGVDLDGGLSTVGKGALRALASGSETAEGTRVVGDVLPAILIR